MKKKQGVLMLVSEKFTFKKGIYCKKIQHIPDLSHFPFKVNRKGKLQEEYTNIHHFKEQEGHDGPVSLHWPIREIPSYQTIQYMGIGLKHKTPNKD